MDPARLRDLTGARQPFLAEVGIGIVHGLAPAPEPGVEPSTLDLNRRVKAMFDPSGRLNPRRRVA